MNKLLAPFRIALVAWVLLTGTLIATVISLIPLRIHGATLTNWLTVGMARMILFAFGMKIECPDRERILNHRGLIFPTHDGFMDVIVPACVVPVRFLAAIEVKSKPLLGRLATAAGCYYVNRQDKTSRAEVRVTLSSVDPWPPLILYPEGMLDGKPGIAPFRNGAFAIAQSNHLPYLPIALLYSDFAGARWKNEPMLKAAWRLAQRPGITCKMVPLDPVLPEPSDTPSDLARAAERSIIRALAENADDRFPDYQSLTPDDEPISPSVSWETELAEKQATNQ